MVATASTLLCLATISAGAEHYVRSGAPAQGDGSDWANAWQDLPETLVRGDTYYVADGSYGPVSFNTEESGTSIITIKKATEADHGTFSGWQADYGDGQAVFSPMVRFYTDYWVFDGAVGQGNDAASYGFSIATPTCGTSHSYMCRIESDADHVTIRHVEMENCGEGQPSAQYGIYSPGPCHDIQIAHCYIHNSGRFMLTRQWQDCVIEHNYFENNWSSSEFHGDGISCDYEVDNIYRFNVFDDACHDGCITPGHGPGYGHVSTGCLVYGNLFMGFVSGGIVDAGTKHYANNYQVFNNTIVDAGPNPNCSFGLGSDNVVQNNIWYRSQGVTANGVSDGAVSISSHHLSDTMMADVADFQHWTSPDHPFIDYDGGDFNLKEATEPGVSYPSGLDEDADGTIRGADGIWDRGAYEYQQGGAAGGPGVGGAGGGSTAGAGGVAGQASEGGAAASSQGAGGEAQGYGPSQSGPGSDEQSGCSLVSRVSHAEGGSGLRWLVLLLLAVVRATATDGRRKQEHGRHSPRSPIPKR